MLLKVEGCHDAFGALCTADAQPNQGNLEVDQFKARLQANADQGIYTTTIGQLAPCSCLGRVDCKDHVFCRLACMCPCVNGG